MRDTHGVFETMMTPLYAGAAILLLLSVRQVEAWQKARGHHRKPDLALKDGPVRAFMPTGAGKRAVL